MAARPTWSIDQFILAKKLGGGYASTVHLAICKQTGIQVAIKVYHRCKLSQLNHYQVRREIRIHSCLDHPYVLELFAAFEDEAAIYLVSEYASKGDVFAELDRRGGSMSEGDAVRQVLHPFLSALVYLHRLNIIHRDIKPENLLCTANGTLKMVVWPNDLIVCDVCDVGVCVRVADFGLSIDVNQERPVTRVGTLDYMAPEVVVCPDKVAPSDNKDKPHLYYGCLVDSWAVGVLAYELTVGRAPFAAGSKRATIELILKAQPRFPAWISEPARHFILWALGKQPAKRPGVQQLAQHPWISSHAKAAAAPPLRQLLAGGRAGSAHDLCLLAAGGSAAATVRQRVGVFAPLPEGSSDEEASCDGAAAAAWEGTAGSVCDGGDDAAPCPPAAMFGSASSNRLAAVGAAAPLQPRLGKCNSASSVDTMRAMAEPPPAEPSFACFEPGGRLYTPAWSSTLLSAPQPQSVPQTAAPAPPPLTAAADAAAAPAPLSLAMAADAAAAAPLPARLAPPPLLLHSHHDSASSLASMVGDLKSMGSGCLAGHSLSPTMSHLLGAADANGQAQTGHPHLPPLAAAAGGAAHAPMPHAAPRAAAKPAPLVQLARMPSGASSQHSRSSGSSRSSSGGSSTATSVPAAGAGCSSSHSSAGVVNGSGDLPHSDSCRSLTNLKLSVMPRPPSAAAVAAPGHCIMSLGPAASPAGAAASSRGSACGAVSCAGAAASGTGGGVPSAAHVGATAARRMFDSPTSMSPVSRSSQESVGDSSGSQGLAPMACSSTGSAVSMAISTPTCGASSCGSEAAAALRSPGAVTPHFTGQRLLSPRGAAPPLMRGCSKLGPCPGGTLGVRDPCPAHAVSELRLRVACHSGQHGGGSGTQSLPPAVQPVTCRRSVSPPSGGMDAPAGAVAAPAWGLPRHGAAADLRDGLSTVVHMAAAVTTGGGGGGAAGRPLSCFSFLSSWRPTLDLPPL